VEDSVKSVSEVATEVATDIESAGAALAAAATGPSQPVAQSKWYRWRKDGTALIAYLLDSEVHTFAFSVAANAIISFIPFVVLLYTLALSVFHSQAMKSVVDNMVNYFLPSATTTKGWVTYYIVHEAVYPHPLVNRHGAQIFSLVMILISCTGIFLPLEVALNQAWGVKKSRNYLFNQSIAVGLALLMLGMAVVCMVANVAVDNALPTVFFHHTDNVVFRYVSGSVDFAWLAVSTGVASILFFFTVYYILPNRKVPWRPVLRTSIITGLVWLLSRFIYAAVLPHLDLQSLYGPFFISVGLLFWAYVSGLILFAGAQFSVARIGNTDHKG
jgi:YihY family inner membrane protein